MAQPKQDDFLTIKVHRDFAFILMMLLQREGIGEPIVNQISEQLGTGCKITPLGKYIREIRLKNNITLLEMADALGMKPSELCGIETGYLEKPRFFAAAVAQYFSGALIHFDCAKLFELDGLKMEDA